MPPSEPPHLPSLEQLQHKLNEAADDTDSTADSRAEQTRGIGIAMRLGVELLAGLLVGVGVGYVLDDWLGTRPWLLIACIFLGSAAGFLNLMRAAQRLDKQGDSGKTPSR